MKDFTLTVNACVRVTLTTLHLRLRPLQECIRFYTTVRRAPSKRPCNTQTVQECFDRCKKLPWGTCLSRALAQVRLLRLHGIEAACIIGMEKSPDFKAHAWVDISPENDRFAAEDSFPSRIKLGQNGRAK